MARRAKMGPADAGGSKSNVSGSIIGIGRTITAYLLTQATLAPPQSGETLAVR